ncbi:Fn3-like domain protein [uncultured archaeon]|nr:Fn3-like domain protein [uncultured archaeon]
MNKYATIVAAMLLMSMFAVVEAGSASGQGREIAKKMISAPPVPVRELQAMNFTKLEISPGYGNIRLQPGESKEMNVTIKNKDNKTVSVRPNIVTMPGEYVLDSAWIRITPDSADIPAGGSIKFTINASVPEDATVGYYSAEIAFTDEEMPTPYPQPFPYYIHALQLSVEIWSSPKIQISTPYISDQLESGKEYNFEIMLKNTGDKAVGINPTLGSDVYYGGPYGVMPPASMEEAITITAPANIQAGSTGIVKVHVRVPSDATGYYNGYIDLGIDDPAVREWEGRVSLNFNIWNQPTEAFVRTFNLTKAVPITIEISSSYYASPYVNSQGTTSREPSFEITLENPSGVITRLNLTKRLIKGSVNLGSDSTILSGTTGNSMYQENGIQYIETYMANGQPGTWKLRVLPGNTQGFEYGITIGE